MMTFDRLSATRLLAILLGLLAPTFAFAQVNAQQTSQATPAERSTGLPGGIDWTFNLDAGWGTFGFANSLFDNPKEPVQENLSDQWFEGYVKPALSGTYRLASSSEVFGKVSVVGERTYGSVPDAFGSDVSSFGPEDAFIGWRSGKSMGSSENLLEFTVGRSQYRLGHGFLLYDGSAEGGSRGGYWTNARKAFEFAAVARAKPGPHTAELFYLDKDELDESDSGTRLWGANYELAVGSHSTVGATYMKFFADPDMRPGRDGLNVFNLRSYAAPIAAVPDLTFEFEYASERNGEALDSNAWTLQGGYQLSAIGWKPKLSYRYAFFQGDDPETTANEGFDPLLLGFYDWGTWWQGEIGGEYFSVQLQSDLPSASCSRLAQRTSRRRRHLLQVSSRSTTGVRSFRDGQGCRFRDRPVRGLESEREGHAQRRRRLRQSSPGRRAVLRPHEELPIRHGVPCLQLLSLIRLLLRAPRQSRRAASSSPLPTPSSSG